MKSAPRSLMLRGGKRLSTRHTGRGDVGINLPVYAGPLGGLSEAGVIIDPPRHDRQDDSASLAAVIQGLKLIQPVLAGFSRVNAQTAWWQVFILVYKTGARRDTFIYMRDKISELPGDGGTLLKEVKLTHPMAGLSVSTRKLEGGT